MPGIPKNNLDYLSNIGNYDHGDDVPMNNVGKALVKLSDFLIKKAANNLMRKGNVASGATKDSMIAGPVETQGEKMSVNINIIDTYKFLDKGVKGTEGGSGKYSFKTKYPNKKMATAILKWLRKRSIASKYKAISRTETKSQKIKKLVSGADNLKALAYAVSTNIKKKGIKPTYFFTDAIKATTIQAKKEFGEALKLDIIETLKAMNKK